MITSAGDANDGATSGGSGWLLVGLGNPGSGYAETRHNLGFMVLDLVAAEKGVRIRRSECRSLVGRVGFDTGVVELVKPQTFMNLSGEAVSCLLKKERRSRDRMIVVVDDLALPFGSIRLRTRGSSGSHNGLRSIIEKLGTDEFPRLRIGISPDHEIRNPRNFVLAPFGSREREDLEDLLRRSADTLRTAVVEGFDEAMRRFNG